MSGDQIRLAHVPVLAEPNTLVVLDAHRRTYLGLSRDGEYFHSIRPARAEDPTVQDEKRHVGELACSCAAGAFGRDCYWTRTAAALERGEIGHAPVVPPIPDEAIEWMATPEEAQVP